MIIETGRFGRLSVSNDEVLFFPQGIFGFPEDKKFCFVDPGDCTLILWLQSMDHPEIALPLLEPKIFCPHYTVRLSAMELRDLKLENVNQSAVFNVITIPADVTQMTANMKAPLVINLREKVAKQVVLQESEYNIKTLMFKELRTHLLTIQSQQKAEVHSKKIPEKIQPLSIQDIPPSLTVKSLLL